MSIAVSGVDFVSVPTRDLEAARRFYGETVGLRGTVHMPERGYAESTWRSSATRTATP